LLYVLEKETDCMLQKGRRAGLPLQHPVLALPFVIKLILIALLPCQTPMHIQGYIQ